MQIKNGYKHTEVGVIPEEWEVPTLDNLCDKVMVGIASAATFAYRVTGVPLIRNQNIKAGYLDDYDVLYIAPEYASGFRNKQLLVGDLLTARTGYPGTTCVVPEKYSKSQSFTTLISRPKNKLVDSVFLCYYINSQQGKEFFEQNQIGGGQKNVNAASLRTMPVPLPPLPEQKVIAAALSDMDAFLKAQEAAIAKKRDLKTAAMHQLLSGKRRLPGFSGDWENKKLEKVAVVDKGTLITEKGISPGHVPVIAGGKQPAYFHNQANRIGRTITISASGANAGYVSIYNDAIFASDCSTISEAASYNLDFIYFSLLLNQERIYRAQTGGAQPHIHPKDLYPLEIQLPPTLAEQNAIAAVLSDMGAEIAQLEATHHKTRDLKTAMMQQLLTGAIRLV